MKPASATVTVFATSAAVLVIEIVAGRLLAPYVGVSLETFTAIIGTVLAGIALGAAIGGRLADRHDPRRLIPGALVLGGCLTWLSMPIVAAVGPRVGNDATSIIVLTTVAFLAPAAVLSAVSPMVTKLRLGSLADTGSVVGEVSAAGTAGALVGSFVTGFVLLATLPTRTILIGVGAALVASGLAVWWRSGRVSPVSGLLALTVVSAPLGLSASPPCQYETSYFCVTIVAVADDPTGRDLYLDDLRHGHVDLVDPTRLEVRYVRLFAQVTDALGERPLDAVHIGGGSFTFPRYLDAVRPGSDQLVLEIDSKLVDIVRAELGLRLHDRLRVRTGDARLALTNLADDAHDLVVGDAFASLSVPWHLTTAEVVAEIRRTLRPDGIYVLNVIDGGRSRFARAELATLAHEFAHVAVVLPPEGVGDRPVNQVLVASDSPLDGMWIDPHDGLLLTGEDATTYIGDARRLTDDFAPVDQLILGR